MVLPVAPAARPAAPAPHRRTPRRMLSRPRASIVRATGPKHQEDRMNGKTQISRALLVAAGLLFAVSSAARAQQIIFPLNGMPGGHYKIVVVSDGYAADESWKFDRAVNGLVLNGLMADKFYKDRGDKFTIIKLFKPVGTSQQSAFGIKPNYDITKCFIDYDENATTTAIYDAVGTLTPERTIVIGNYEGVSLGCS